MNELKVGTKLKAKAGMFEVVAISSVIYIDEYDGTFDVNIIISNGIELYEKRASHIASRITSGNIELLD